MSTLREIKFLMFKRKLKKKVETKLHDPSIMATFSARVLINYLVKENLLRGEKLH
jgi:hypothetical protein